MKKNAFIISAIFVSLIGLYLTINYAWLCDDIFISFIYAKNFLEGNGLVYNPGERVEGFTHPLWVFFLIIFKYIGIDFEITPKILGILSFIGIIFLLFAISYKREKLNNFENYFFPLAAIFCISNYDFIIWTTGGLETMFYAFLVFLIFYVLNFSEYEENKKTIILGGLSGLLLLTRPDGAVFILALLFSIAIKDFFFEINYAKIAKKVFSIGALAFAIFLPYFIFRILYYGDIYPNTYYAKDGDKFDIFYIIRFGLVYIYYYFYVYIDSFLIFAANVYLIFKNLKTKDRLKNYLKDSNNFSFFSAIVFILFYLILFVARYGGDFMFARFIIPIVPLLYFSGEFIIASYLNSKLKYFYGLLFSFLILFSSYFLRGEFFEAGEQETKYIPLVGEVETTKNPFIKIDFVADENDVYFKKENYQIDSNVALNFSVIEFHKFIGSACKSLFENEDFYLILVGMQNSFAFYSNIKNKIEVFGLTDRNIAKSKSIFARPGHRKVADYNYLFQKKVLFSAGKMIINIFNDTINENNLNKFESFSKCLFQTSIKHRKFGEINLGVFFYITIYQEDVLNKLKEKTNGAFQYPKFDENLEIYMKEELPHLSFSEAMVDYEFFKKLYFNANNNPELEKRLLEKIRELK